MALSSTGRRFWSCDFPLDDWLPGDPSLRLKSGSGRDDFDSEESGFRLSHCSFRRLLDFVHAECGCFRDPGDSARALSAMPHGKNLPEINMAVSGDA